MTPQADWKTIADRFVAFFRARDHAIVPSSSLVPGDDPTLLFTNAGMVQFKDVFLGREQRAYRRAATLQKCMRVQGKHNDLDVVGPSPRHHTFFLMLGNFSFGDYFKREAIAFAWELMTREYAVDPNRLISTVHTNDEDALDAWRRVGVPSDRTLRMGDATNFWAMADVGPCGPTSELHFDWGPEHCTCRRPDCSVALDNGCLRWLEIWNLVFMQFDQQPGGTRVPLPRPGVDTGMGLERIASVLQDVNDNYGTDLFMPLLDHVQRLLGHGEAERREHHVAYRVMADHGRAMTFLMADGVLPGNEGRNYVLRMIMRRAMRFGRSAGATQPFLAGLAGAVIDAMGGAYAELVQQRALIQTAARQEEERFAQTLTTGLERLEELIAQTRARGEQVLPGDEVFRLYDTFGFPVEMTRDVARERGMAVDDGGFERAMAAQRARARAAQTFAAAADDRVYAQLARTGMTSKFVGDTRHRARGKVLAILRGGERVREAEAGTAVEVILDRTPFYPEGGGQVGDTGVLRSARCVVEVTDTRRPVAGLILHRGTVTQGTLREGQAVRAEIDVPRRWDVMRNHTATHLLHRALRDVLGEHARQSGSLVAPDRLRFDFVHLAPLTPQERTAIERRVNEQILADLPVRARWMSYEEAMRLGATALFGEKYGDRVRVISIDGYSRELCGGTHLSRTSQVGVFKITSEGSVAAGVRRVEAVTGRGALALLDERDTLVRALAEQLRSAPAELPERIRRLEERQRELEREARSARAQAHTRGEAPQLQRTKVGDITFIVQAVPLRDYEELRRSADAVREELAAHREQAIVAVISEGTGRVVVTTNSAVHAGQFARAFLEAFGGRGGGSKPSLGQGQLVDPARLPEVMQKSRERDFIESVLKSIS